MTLTRRSWPARILAIALFGTLASCGGGSSPTAPGAPTGAGSVTVTGRVVGTVHGQPVLGARIEMAGVAATTDGEGNFRMAVSAQGVVAVRVSASRHVTRNSFIRTDGPPPLIDIIEEDTLWNLDFYRELCRDAGGKNDPKPLNPWTVEPRFYIDTRPESGSARPIADESVETVIEAIQTVLPLLTRGRLRGDRIETGVEPPDDLTDSTVVIRWNPVEVAQEAGPAAAFTRGVGGNASVVVIRTNEDTESVFHELGHVLGLYHPVSGFRPSYMLGSGKLERPHFTDWDILHANILYARPRGNTDIDNDPTGFVINDPSALSLGDLRIK